MSEDIQIRAARAQQLQDDEVLKEALDGITNDALIMVGTASLTNASECIAAVAAVQAVGAFSSKLVGFITSGKAAERKKVYVA